ncbi:MAG: ATP-binding cassette domain-containing protein, partial [Blastocatellia bacterium]
LDDNNTVIDELRTVAATTVTDGEMRDFLGRFLFSGDDVFKPVTALSGGERGRLALGKLIYKGHNVLILDEPTNHLDIASCEALEDALNEYDGTIITVSHDRYFLDRIATQVLFFHNGSAEYFDGGYTEFYEAHHRAQREAADQARAAEAARRAAEAQPKPAAAKPNAGKTNKERKKQQTPETFEKQIHAIEAEMLDINASMSSDAVARDHARLLELSARYQTLEKQLPPLYETWEAALAAAE